MNEYYWELTLMNGDKISIPPEYVELVKRKWKAKENIEMKNRTIPAHQIVDFERTARMKMDKKMIEDVARAFGDPIVRKRQFVDGTTDEAVSAKWVKKRVTQKEWEKFYGANAYKKLSNDGGVITVAFVVPTHLIDLKRVDYCNKVEIAELTK